MQMCGCVSDLVRVKPHLTECLHTHCSAASSILIVPVGDEKLHLDPRMNKEK